MHSNAGRPKKVSYGIGCEPGLPSISNDVSCVLHVLRKSLSGPREHSETVQAATCELFAFPTFVDDIFHENFNVFYFFLLLSLRTGRKPGLTHIHTLFGY